MSSGLSTTDPLPAGLPHHDITGRSTAGLVRIGVIGYGYWGPNIVRNFSALDRCELVSVCDQSAKALKRAQKAYPGVRLTADFVEVLRATDIDAVAIVTPVWTHFDLAKAALENGKHVFLEKPFTSTSAQASELIELAARNNLRIMVDHTFLFSGAVRKMRELVDNGTLGPLYYFDSTRVNLGLFQHDVSVVWDLAPHDLAIMDHIVRQPPEAVVATGGNHFNNLADMAFITVYFPGNVTAHINVNWLSPVKVRTGRVNRFLGTSIAGAEIGELLTPIGFEVVEDTADETLAATVYHVTVPSFRPDTVTETDIIEEIARHYGYSRIPRTVPPAVRTGGLTPRQSERRGLRQTLVGLGCDEAMPLPFLSAADIERAGLTAGVITVSNPLDAAESVLRPSLRPGLLKAVAYNASHRHPGVKLFEIGKVFGRPAEGQRLPNEHEALAVILAGEDARGAVDTWQVIAESLAVPDFDLQQVAVEGLHATRSAEIVVAGTVVGLLGEIDPTVLEAFAIGERVAWLELDLDQLLALPHGERSYAPISRFPSSDIDLAFEVADTVAAADVEATIRTAGGPLLADLRLFDVYRGAGLPAGHRSLAYRLRLQATDRTLTDQDIAGTRQAVIDSVTAAYAAQLRG